jgi:hypothetical protein
MERAMPAPRSEVIVTPAELLAYFRYDPTDGLLEWRERPREWFRADKDWKRWNTRYAGRAAFSINRNGYLSGYVNGIRTDNRIANLRLVTKSENSRNAARKASNKSGVTGVLFRRGRWTASIRHDGKGVTLGTFGSKEEATLARQEAEQRFGYHPNHGRRAPADPRMAAPSPAAQGARA